MDCSSGYNFQDPKTGAFKRSNVLLGTSVVVSFWRRPARVPSDRRTTGASVRARARRTRGMADLC